MGIPQALLLTNQSTENLHDINFSFDNSNERLTIVWRPNSIPLLQGKSLAQISAITLIHQGDGTAELEYGVEPLIQRLHIRGRHMVPLGEISFTCRDRANNLYKVNTPMLYLVESNELRFQAAKRVLVPE
jgi:hypothetical protein